MLGSEMVESNMKHQQIKPISPKEEHDMPRPNTSTDIASAEGEGREHWWGFDKLIWCLCNFLLFRTSYWVRPLVTGHGLGILPNGASEPRSDMCKKLKLYCCFLYVFRYPFQLPFSWIQEFVQQLSSLWKMAVLEWQNPLKNSRRRTKPQWAPKRNRTLNPSNRDIL